MLGKKIAELQKPLGAMTVRYINAFVLCKNHEGQKQQATKKRLQKTVFCKVFRTSFLGHQAGRESLKG